MSCPPAFTNLAWPSCAPDPSKGIYECSDSVKGDCCLSVQTGEKLYSNCPTGFESVPANGEWCTSSWNPFGNSTYRHKCKRKPAPGPPPSPCPPPVPCPACPPPPPPVPCPACPPVVPPEFGIVYALANPAKFGEKTFEIMLGWTSPNKFRKDVSVYAGDPEQPIPILGNQTNVEAGMFVTKLELPKPSSSSVVYRIELNHGGVGFAETMLQVDFPDFANNNLNCGEPERMCESYEKCIGGNCEPVYL